MKIAFIGLGAMGLEMSRRLLHGGYDLHVYDMCDDRVADLETLGAAAFASPAQAAQAVDVIFTCLPGPAEVLSVARQDQGLLSILSEGQVWFELSTIDLDTIAQLHADCLSRKVAFLDAPISGGPRGAASGDLALWVGGDEGVYTTHCSLLQYLGSEAMYVGPSGCGCITKLVHNGANFVVQSVLAEAFSLGVKAGLDPAKLFRAIRQGSTGRARTFDRLAEQFLRGQYEPAKFSLRLAKKDMNLVLELANKNNYVMPFAKQLAADIDRAMQKGWSEKDARIVLHLNEIENNISVKINDSDLEDILKK